MRRWGILAGLLAALGARAAAPELRVRAGFGGQQIEGRALPVAVDVHALDTAVSGSLSIPVGEDPEFRPDALYTTAVDVPAGGVKTYRIVITNHQQSGDLLVDLIDRNRSRYRKSVTLRNWSNTTKLVATVNSTASGLRFVQRPEPDSNQAAKPGGKPPLPGIAVANLTVADLPSTAAGLEAVTLLVLNDESFSAVDDAVRGAVEQYVRSGGHLVLVGGPAAAGLWQDSLIRRLSPVAVSGLRAISGAEAGQLAEHGTGPWHQPTGSFAGAAGRLVRGELLCGTATAPLLAACRLDRGKVTFLALPFDQAPLRDWPGLESYWRRLVDSTRVSPRSSAYFWGPFYPLALRFQGVELPAVSTVAAFLLAYLVVLVPLQFGVLARLRRRELAWVVTPAIVLVFSVGAYALGGALRGQKLHANATGVLLAEAGSQTAHLIGIQALYSPARRQYDLRPPAGTQRLALLASSPGYAGLYDPAANLARGERYVIETSPGGVWLPQLPVQMWSARGVGFDSPVRLPAAAELTVRSRSADKALLLARSPWPQPLLATALVYGGAVHRLGELAPQRQQQWPLRLPAPTRRAGRQELTESLVAALAAPALQEFSPPTATAALNRLLQASQRDDVATTTGLDVQEPALWGWLEQPGQPFELGPGVRPAKAAQAYLVRITFSEGR